MVEVGDFSFLFMPIYILYLYYFCNKKQNKTKNQQ